MCRGCTCEDSPVGYASVPFVVGGNGWVFYDGRDAQLLSGKGWVVARGRFHHRHAISAT